MKEQAIYVGGVPGLMMREDYVERMLNGERFIIWDGGIKVRVWIDEAQKARYEDLGLSNAAQIAAWNRGLVKGILGFEVKKMTPSQRKKYLPFAGRVLGDMALKGGI